MDWAVEQLVPTLQVAIGPVVMISGIGLLILSMTNRLGRVVDRGRSLAREVPRIQMANERNMLVAQLQVLDRRAELLRQSITFATVSVLLAALLIIVLFLTALFALEVAWLISLLFVLALVTLIVALITFLLDLNQSLAAFKLDIDPWIK